MSLEINPALLEEMRVPLYKYARLHLSHHEDAEDCVQEVMLAFWDKPTQFEGRATLKTYLFGILKNKVADRLRLRYRNQPMSSEGGVNDDFDVWFDERGKWQAQEDVATWGEPEGDLQTRQFLEVLDICLDKLPEKIAAVFSMKEFMDMQADEICQHLSVSKDLYWQCMSRARKSIQLCLTTRWFQGERHAAL